MSKAKGDKKDNKNDQCCVTDYLQHNDPNMYGLLKVLCQLPQNYFNDRMTLIIPLKEDIDKLMKMGKTAESRAIIHAHIFRIPIYNAQQFKTAFNIDRGVFKDAVENGKDGVTLTDNDDKKIELVRENGFIPFPMGVTRNNYPHQVIFRITSGSINPKALSTAEHKEVQGGSVSGGANPLLENDYSSIENFVTERVKEVIKSKTCSVNKGKLSPSFMIDLVSFYYANNSPATRNILDSLWGPCPIALWFTVFSSLSKYLGADIARWINSQSLVSDPVASYKRILAETANKKVQLNKSADISANYSALADALAIPGNQHIMVDYHYLMYQEYLDVYKKIAMYRQLVSDKQANEDESQELRYYRNFVNLVRHGFVGERVYRLVKNGDLYYETDKNTPLTPQGLVDIFERSDLALYPVDKQPPQQIPGDLDKEVARISVKTPLIANKAYSYLSEVYASRKVNVNSLVETIKTLSPQDRAQIAALLR
jgi:hypothetical protein